jgi:hypothetical protein
MTYRVLFCYRSQIPAMIQRIHANHQVDSPVYENYDICYQSYLERAMIEWGRLCPRAQYQAEMLTWASFCEFQESVLRQAC